MHVKSNFRIDVGIDKIKEYLLSVIDTTSPVEVEKVGRYLKHIEMYRRMERTVKKDGVSTIVINGSQEYVKSHPLLSEMNKLNAAIISIEKSFVFKKGTEDSKYTANDLI